MNKTEKGEINIILPIHNLVLFFRMLPSSQGFVKLHVKFELQECFSSPSED